MTSDYLIRRRPSIPVKETIRNYRDLLDLQAPYLLCWERSEDEMSWH